jgi:regulation of enolase protein 1 (concanavalin A-like superfamily)
MDRSTFDGFQWLNKGTARWEGDAFMIDAPAMSDFFCGQEEASTSEDLPKNLNNAPFFFTEVTGDFVMRVQVSHAFKDTYDAATIMVMENLEVWAKACFEKTDFGTHAAVSVVTNRVSDDANGCNIDGDTAWLQVSRVNNSFSFHYSLDGTRFDMMRYFSLPVSKTIKVGLVAQSPMGKGGERIFKQFSLQRKTVKNLRSGE